ncbi:unnamed protein product [Alopecurus aequalis]
MAIKDARKVESKKRHHAAASSSVAMAEMPPHGANHVQPSPQPLPPGVYFSPTPEECLGFLNRRIAGDTELRDARGHIRHANVYGESPDALRQRHPPASFRERERTWWFMSETKFQSRTAGGGASKRKDRQVEAGTYWRLEQSKEKLDDDGFKNTFGFYVGPHKKKDKTPWLMQEFTSTNDDGAGKGGVPALYRVYVTPRATDEQLRRIYGEDGVKHEPDGTKKPGRAMIPAEYFNRIAALLPPGSVRGVAAQEHVQAPPPLPLVAPEGHLDDFYGQQKHYLGQYQQQQGQPVAPDGLHDDFNVQQGQYLGQYQQQQYLDQYYEQQQEREQYVGQYYEQEHVQAPPLPLLSPVAPEGLLDDSYSQQEQYQYQCQQEQEQYQYQCQQEQYLGQYYEQQQEPLSVIAPPIPPPASPGLLAELAASENLSMPMADLMSMLDDNGQPAEPVKGEEPNWDSLDDIVDDDELANFNKEG